MKKTFKNIEFLFSSDGRQFPKEERPHVALMGRSNVGKSSLINHFFMNKNLCRTSSVPGKTRLLNFFSVENKYYFVDLPGFGYGKASHKERNKWIEMINTYLDRFGDQALFLHLLDCRHMPSEYDKIFIDWAQQGEKKVLYIFTKIDKIKKSARDKAFKALSASLGEDVDYVPYSSKDDAARNHLLRKLGLYGIT